MSRRLYLRGTSTEARTILGPRFKAATPSGIWPVEVIEIPDDALVTALPDGGWKISEDPRPAGARSTLWRRWATYPGWRVIQFIHEADDADLRGAPE